MSKCDGRCPVEQFEYASTVGAMIEEKDRMVQLIGKGAGFAVSPEILFDLLENFPPPQGSSNPEELAAEASRALKEQLADNPEVLQDTAAMLDAMDDRIALAELEHADKISVLQEDCPGAMTLKGGGYCVRICRSPFVIDDGSYPVPTIVRRTP